MDFLNKNIHCGERLERECDIGEIFLYLQSDFDVGERKSI